jgi:hypothetical protein
MTERPRFRADRSDLLAAARITPRPGALVEHSARLNHNSADARSPKGWGQTQMGNPGSRGIRPERHCQSQPVVNAVRAPLKVDDAAVKNGPRPTAADAQGVARVHSTLGTIGDQRVDAAPIFLAFQSETKRWPRSRHFWLVATML